MLDSYLSCKKINAVTSLVFKSRYVISEQRHLNLAFLFRFLSKNVNQAMDVINGKRDLETTRISLPQYYALQEVKNVVFPFTY